MKKKTIAVVAAVLAVTAIIGGAVYFYMYYIGHTNIRNEAEPQEGQILVACVGDSVTYGYGIKDSQSNNYPALLGADLGEEYCVANFGESGLTVQPDGDQPYPDSEVHKAALNFECDILIFLLGSNDSKPENWKGAEKFRRDYETLLDSFLEGDKKPEIILCTPPKAFFPEGKSEGLTNYDIQPAVVEEIRNIVIEVATARQLRCIDLYALTAPRRDLFFEDCVHPNGDGAKFIAEVASGYIKSIEVK